MQVCRYFDNNDTPSFAIKDFNDSPIDLYPSFSYCFEDKFGGIYNKRYFSEFDGLTRQKYQKALMGENELLPNYLDPNAVNIFDIDVDNVTLMQKHLFYYMEIKSGRNNDSVENTQRYQGSNGDEFFHLYKSYQDPIKICFTRKSYFEEGLIRQTEELHTVLAKMLSKWCSASLKACECLIARSWHLRLA